MLHFLSTVFKIGLASLIVGVVLARFNMSAEQILLQVGMTPERVYQLGKQAVRWAVPNIVLGSIVVVPVWLVIYLFKPPRG